MGVQGQWAGESVCWAFGARLDAAGDRRRGDFGASQQKGGITITSLRNCIHKERRRGKTDWNEVQFVTRYALNASSKKNAVEKSQRHAVFAGGPPNRVLTV
ncbi:hypothetical protein EVAR_84461_1 [Eumeta japonica]|uniref:Uncharacterized protein n=1 Tax=Eumeta variegata TaxID=151549 RepID=A0A4C1X843_EUMVA|nr:hypothetical protein EVAR_84461_1 [Eumeta japonica]